MKFSNLCAGLALFAMSSVVMADGGSGGGSGQRRSGPDVMPVSNASYAEECGACHFAYQPGLLPARSWQKLMGGLDKHFGENAELSATTRDALLAYLTTNAADRSEQRRSQRMADSIRPSQTPLRISEVPYFRHEHGELSRRQVQDNPKVRSLSNCDACHSGAQRGSFSERELRIPGYGRWED